MSYEFLRHIDHADNITDQDVQDLRSGQVTIMVIDNATEHTMERFGTLATQNQHTTEGRGFDVKGDKFFRVGSDDKNVPHVHLNENMPWHHDRGYTDPFPYVGLFCVEWQEGAPPTRFADMRKAYLPGGWENAEGLGQGRRAPVPGHRCGRRGGAFRFYLGAAAAGIYERPTQCPPGSDHH